MVWNFYLPNADAMTNWTNHAYVLQFVCSGLGATPEEAWRNARESNSVPDGFLLGDYGIAVLAGAERTVALWHGRPDAQPDPPCPRCGYTEEPDGR